jgi:phospho-N-acetylmuramoyl-pentapeptide-transferase
MWVFGLLGVIDDLRGLRAGGGEGWLARNKFAWQWGLAGLVSLATYLLTASHPLIIPISGAQIEMGAWQIPLLAYLLVAFSNAVNLADGLDGLAGGMSAIAYGTLGLLAAWTGQHGLGQVALAIVGALLAFLWYNAHPARVFMGDIGAQALGAGLASLAVLSGHWLLLPIIGIVFVAESLSVMVQVSYFKYTRRRYGEGRRILRMAPLHYHYEKGGWSETWIVARFWLISALAAACGLVLGLV